MSLGPEDSSDQVALVPSSAAVLQISGCRQLEILSKSLNTLTNLQNVTIKDVHSVILHSRLHEARVGNGQSSSINNFEIENVSLCEHFE